MFTQVCVRLIHCLPYLSYFLWIICHFIFNIWLSSCIMQFIVPFFDTWNIFMKKLSCTFWSLSKWVCSSPIQLSEFDNNCDAIFYSNCSTGPQYKKNLCSSGCISRYNWINVHNYPGLLSIQRFRISSGFFSIIWMEIFGMFLTDNTIRKSTKNYIVGHFFENPEFIWIFFRKRYGSESVV